MKFLKASFVVCLISLISILIINLIVVYSTEKNIVTDSDKRIEHADFILVLGAAVWQNKRPSFILEDRLLTGIKVFKNLATTAILLSGDHGKENYDEVSVMERFTREAGVHAENIVLDLEGFSTYDSCYNARNKFKAKKIVIITQKYHLHRAIYIARSLGIEAYGVASDLRKLNGDTFRSVREVFARVKDFFLCLTKPAPNSSRKS